MEHFVIDLFFPYYETISFRYHKIDIQNVINQSKVHMQFSNLNILDFNKRIYYVLCLCLKVAVF